MKNNTFFPMSLAILGLMACTPGANTFLEAKHPTPHQTASPAASGVSLSGTWLFGEGSAPTEPHLSSDCPAPRLELRQQGQTMTLVRTDGCGLPTEVIEGQLEGERLQLSGQRQEGLSKSSVTYDLRYDSGTGMITGTRNNQPFWMVQTHSPCPSPPTLCMFPVRGTIYYEDGTVAKEELKVRVMSLDDSLPFDSIVDAKEGQYEMHVYPARSLEFSVMRGDQVVMTRVLNQVPGYNVVLNFGGAETGDDPHAATYGITR